MKYFVLIVDIGEGRSKGQIRNNSVNTEADTGLMPSGTKPFPDTVLTRIFENIWCHWATMIKQIL